MLDARALNPHRRVWHLERGVRLDGLELRENAGVFRAGQVAVVSESKLYLRPDGPWYDVSGREAAQREGIDAGERWSTRLRRGATQLELRMGRVSGKSREEAERAIRLSFIEWLGSLEADWEGDLQAEPEIPQKGAMKPGPWEQRLEPVGSSASSKPLARAPARRWNGLFTIRVTVDVGDRKLTGQFLLDSGSPVSLISPAWLLSQGANPALIEVLGSPSRRVRWSGGGVVARPGLVMGAEISGYAISLDEFWLADVDLFGPPNYAVVCCDGVLGLDFLRSHVVEFIPTRPAAVMIWPKEGFGRPGFHWAEALVRATGERGRLPEGVSATARLVSEGCRLEGSGAAPGVRWDTGWAGDVAASADSREGRSDRRIACPAFRFEEPSGVSKWGESGREVVAGMALLSRAKFVLDLPHGRIWFEPAALHRRSARNRSGLRLQFVTNPAGDRELRVQAIDPRSPAGALERQGLKPGVIVTRIDSVDAADLDLWEVEQRLAGQVSSSVTLQWKIKDGLRSSPLVVAVHQ